MFFDFSNYFLTVIFVTVFIILAEILVVNGKNSKIFKMILSMVITLTFITPILEVFNYDLNTVEINSNVEYSNHLKIATENVTKKEVEAILNYEKLTYENVSIETQNINGQISTKKVEITLTCDGINCQTKHINITTKINALLLEKIFINNSEVEIAVKFKENY